MKNDITDHLPMFAVFHNLLESKNETIAKTYSYIRNRSPEILLAFQQDLGIQNWSFWPCWIGSIKFTTNIVQSRNVWKRPNMLISHGYRKG